jgi:hypothetical protein
MGYFCILSLLGRYRSGGSWFEASLGKKLVRPYLNKLAIHGGTHLYSSWAGDRGRSIAVKGKLETLSEKYLKQKGLGTNRTKN